MTVRSINQRFVSKFLFSAPDVVAVLAWVLSPCREPTLLPLPALFAQEYEEEIISDSSEEEEEAEPDEFDVDEFGRTKEEAAAAANDESGNIESKHGNDGAPSLTQHASGSTAYGGGTALEEDPASQVHPDHVAVRVATTATSTDDPANTKSPEHTRATANVETTIVGQEESGKL